jgi:hypothetical protein
MTQQFTFELLPPTYYANLSRDAVLDDYLSHASRAGRIDRLELLKRVSELFPPSMDRIIEGDKYLFLVVAETRHEADTTMRQFALTFKLLIGSFVKPDVRNKYGTLCYRPTGVYSPSPTRLYTA